MRRAVSAGYYALFHAIALGVARQLLGTAAASNDEHHLARSIDHRALAEVCSWVTASSGAGKKHARAIVASLQQDAEVRRLADIVVRLQEERHSADYDHLATYTKASVLALLNQTEWALSEVDSASASGHTRLYALVALNSSLR